MSYQATYTQTADTLVGRILALIPEHPEILETDDPWKLFKVDGFQCGDIGPSLFQASCALNRAKQLWRVTSEKEESR